MTVAALLILLLMGPSISRAGQWMKKPEPMEEIKPVLAYIHNHLQPGDVVCVYRPTQPAFFYYQSSMGLETAKLFLCQGTDAQTEHVDVDQLVGHPRVWVLITHDRPALNVAEAKPMVDYLNARGRRLDEMTDPDNTAKAYLYDMVHPATRD